MSARKELWHQRRQKLCLASDSIPLNAGTCSPLPKKIFEQTQIWRAFLASDPTYFLTQVAPLQIELSRKKTAEFFSTGENDLLFFPNVSHALNLILQNFPFYKGAEILTTDQEYPHYWNLFQEIENKKGCRFKRIHIPFATEASLDAKHILELFQKQYTSKTQALYLSHVSCQTGFVLPLQEICAWANEKNLQTIIDGAHAVGALPVNLSNINPTFYAGNFHKWMMGATGSSFLYVHPDFRKDLKPFCWTQYYPWNEEEILEHRHSTHFANAFEYQGTRDPSPWMVISDVIDFFKEIPLNERMQHSAYLRNFCITRLEKEGFELLSSRNPEQSTCMVSFKLPHKVRAAFARESIRNTYNLDVSFPEFENKEVCLRLSTSWFNTEEEIVTAAEILKDIDWSELT